MSSIDNERNRFEKRWVEEKELSFLERFLSIGQRTRVNEWKRTYSRLLCVMHDHQAMRLLNNLSEYDKGPLLRLVLAFH